METEGDGGMGFSGCLSWEIVWIDGQVGMQFQIGSRHVYGWENIVFRKEETML